MRVPRHFLALAATFALACAAETKPPDSGVPYCPTGAVVTGDAVCGTCTRPHLGGECPAEYVCTCALECVWFEHGFPVDAGGIACGLDAGIADATTAD